MRALKVAWAREARSLELRVASGLAHLWAGRGEARGLQRDLMGAHFSQDTAEDERHRRSAANSARSDC
jgi:hypothetical protein